MCSHMNYGLTKLNVRKMAYEVAAKSKKKFSNRWNETKLAGNDWLYGFMKRHSDLYLRKPEACSLSRATAFSKHTVAAFFEKLKNVYNRNVEFANGTRLFNLDETSTSTVQKPRNVTLKEQKQVLQVTSSERGTLVTTCCYVNALGYLLPLVMIFPRVHFKKHMIEEAPTETLGLANPSG